MGERFGNYELLEKIAVGGMAEIFKARATHGRGVEKTVCIKRIHPALSADRNFVAMFIDEARLGVSMVHGNVVPVFDFGCVDGHYFLAMEYVSGQDLAGFNGRARVVGLRWPLDAAFHVVMEVLEGLEYAHHKRDGEGRPLELVHRDVSPSNILLSRDGEVKLLDFGIARSHAREFETRTGVIKGKPGYMSPEQAAGMVVDARADVWSCGAVLHELVCDMRLKDGRRRVGDPQIDAVLDKALAANRDNRFETARKMQDALADILTARGLRASAGGLAAFIGRVEEAPAPGENWDMSSHAVEEHVAAALKPAPVETGAELLGTHRLAPPSRPKSAQWLGLAAGLAAVGVAIALLWPAGAGKSSTAKPAPPVAARPAPARPAPVSAPTPAPAPVAPAPIETAEAKPAAPANRPKTAEVSINSKPWSNVTLDGKPAGATPIRDLKIPAGKHKVVLTNPVLGLSRTLSFSVKPGEDKLIREVLSE
ncbi:MAG: serine/threonine protein kinase [Deltaproteobacteria bacterium]|nr:serine/threonine protein kinase [Deltaproteobacteria bacterium]